MNAEDVDALARALHRTLPRTGVPAERIGWLSAMEAIADVCTIKQRQFNRPDFYLRVKGDLW